MIEQNASVKTMSDSELQELSDVVREEFKIRRNKYELCGLTDKILKSEEFNELAKLVEEEFSELIMDIEEDATIAIHVKSLFYDKIIIDWDEDDEELIFQTCTEDAGDADFKVVPLDERKHTKLIAETIQENDFILEQIIDQIFMNGLSKKSIEDLYLKAKKLNLKKLIKTIANKFDTTTEDVVSILRNSRM